MLCSHHQIELEPFTEPGPLILHHRRNREKSLVGRRTNGADVREFVERDWGGFDARTLSTCMGRNLERILSVLEILLASLEDIDGIHIPVHFPMIKIERSFRDR
jgi:hypothetical protein